MAGKIVFVTQVESYRYRGESLEEYSALKFEMFVDILPCRDAGDTARPAVGS